MAKRNFGRNVQQQEMEQGILKQHPLPEASEGDSNGNSTHFPETLYKIENDLQKTSDGRISPSSLTSEASDERTLVSQSSIRSLSSASSWTDDGFEQEAADKVQQLFDAIDSLLYEGNKLPEECKDLTTECQDWIKMYHHLRVTGSKPNDWQEQEIYYTEPAENATSNLFSKTEDEHEQPLELPRNFNQVENEKPHDKLSLIIEGTTLSPISSFVYSSIEDETSCPAYEEIIEQHGEYEELIAVDYNEENKLHSDLLSDDTMLHSGLEIQIQQIMEFIMKDFWNEIVLCLRPLLEKCIDSNIHGNEDGMTNKSRKTGDSYVINESPSSRLPTPQVTNQGSANLHGLLTISSKTLLNRNANKSNRPVAHTSAPASMVGARLTTPQKVLSKSGGGRLAPLERLAKTTSPASTLAHYESLKTPPLPVHPVSLASWGRHFPLPPIDSGQQSTASTPFVPAVRKVTPTSPAILRMLSGSVHKRGGQTEPNKLKFNSNSYTTAPMSMTNIQTNRLYSAQVDAMQSYPASYAAIGERLKSNIRQNGFSPDFRIQSGSIHRRMGSSYKRLPTYGAQQAQDKAHLSSTYTFSNLERRNNR